ncbi:MAG: hypothetical protein LBV38_01260 [Alistipes sp.]|jgi:hypothetical protein|nr:hypothetical protein [Alistipes sp.]
MRKLALLFAVTLSCVGCFKVPDDVRYDSEWRVRNSTAQTLVISPRPYAGPNTGSGARTLLAGEEVVFYARSEKAYRPYFEMVMVLWRGRADEEISFDVLSTEGVLLKSWRYDVDAAEADGRFFNEANWEYSSDFGKRRKKWASWLFEILPREIEQENQL